MSKEIKLSMGGKGIATNSAFIERSVKYEKIYLNPPSDGLDLFLLLVEYFEYYNKEDMNQSIIIDQWTCLKKQHKLT
ncbi:hypothetical protein [uncultured Zobellia sp.]|uniref:hypothetical protein n=1 Tax=uncultured Zobellia sp. TaxID=255433 RepID=UPI0025930F82|nr:hypothetical protein [uncultured Zobellia sp.]